MKNSYRSPACSRFVTLCCVLFVLFAAPQAFAQIPGLGSEPSTPPSDEALRPVPNLLDLGSNWWDGLQNQEGVLDEGQIQRFLQDSRIRIQGLSGYDLAEAGSDIDNLESLLELLVVVLNTDPEQSIEPYLAKDTYTLSELLQMRAKSRELLNTQDQFSLLIGQDENQFNLLQEKRDELARDYQDADPNSPQRILLALDRIIARVQFELTYARAENLRQRLKGITAAIQDLDQQQTYARAHLGSTDVSLEEVRAAASKAKSKVSSMTENIARLQPQLLEVLSANPPNPGLEILRKQQLTRAVSEAQLSQLLEAKAKSISDWYTFRAGALESDFDYQESLARARQLSDEALQQAELWAEVSQSTLISSPTETDLNTVKNFELAQTAARDTLLNIGQIRGTADDLLLTQDILSAELIATQSGITNSWAKLQLKFQKIWTRMVKLADTHLFDIGDTPVSPAGIFKMLMILVTAFGISWLIRHLLNRSVGHDKVTRRAAVYSLGRLLHYVIILVGTFAALSSIGIDFTSFALIAGALSVGIGFGLQAIVNNFVSGLILLFEGTLRVGDYIQLDSGLSGVVREINTRATVVTTNDSVDVVVPNSELVTTQLTNWTLRESTGRMRCSFGVAYGCDKEEVRRIALESVSEVDSAILHMPDLQPQIRLVSFGDSALEFQTLFWVSRQGVRRPGRTRAAYMWALETRLREAGIEIPFPQRDVHVRSDFRVEPAATPKPPPEAEEKPSQS